MGHHHHDHHHGHHGHHEEYNHSYGYGVPPPATSYYPPLPPAYPAPPPSYNYSPYPYAVQPFQPYAASLPAPYSPHHNPAYQHDQLNHAMADHHRHSRNEHMAEAGAVAAGAFAMYEAHEARVDPLRARRHKLEAEMAGAAALGSAGYAFHEHHEKKKDEHLIAALHGYQGSPHGHGHHGYQGSPHGHGHHNFW